MAQMEMAQMEMAAYDEQPTRARSRGPRVAAAAAPHKRWAVAAGLLCQSVVITLADFQLRVIRKPYPAQYAAREMHNSCFVALELTQY
eukprot:6974120-Prymnesium_polylepis.1